MDNGEATPRYITQFTRFKISLTLVEPNQLSLRICLSDSHQKCQQWVGSGRFHLGFETWIWFSTSWHGFSSGRLLEHRDSGGESSAVESHLSFIVGPYFQSRNVVWGTFFLKLRWLLCCWLRSVGDHYPYYQCLRMMLFPLHSHLCALCCSNMAHEHPNNKNIQKPSSTSGWLLGIVDEDMVAMAKGNLSTFNALRDGRLIIKGGREDGKTIPWCGSISDMTIGWRSHEKNWL